MGNKSPFTSVLVVSDNETILRNFIELIKHQPELTAERTFKFSCHPRNGGLSNKRIHGYLIEPLDVKQACDKIIADHDLILSAHCKQIFPPQLVATRKCINVHPGLNPYNRGWYPQVFSILNHLPLGATIHEIDEELDHGQIIDQEEVQIKASDTSLSAYNRVQEAELRLLKGNLQSILDNDYHTYPVQGEGNLNLKKDFEGLREINLDEQATFGQAIDRLRALTHPPFKNAYFVDPESGKRVWAEIRLKEEQERE